MSAINSKISYLHTIHYRERDEFIMFIIRLFSLPDRKRYPKWAYLLTEHSPPTPASILIDPVSDYPRPDQPTH